MQQFKNFFKGTESQLPSKSKALLRYLEENREYVLKDAKVIRSFLSKFRQKIKSKKYQKIQSEKDEIKRNERKIELIDLLINEWRNASERLVHLQNRVRLMMNMIVYHLAEKNLNSGTLFTSESFLTSKSLFTGPNKKLVIYFGRLRRNLEDLCRNENSINLDEARFMYLRGRIEIDNIKIRLNE